MPGYFVLARGANTGPWELYDASTSIREARTACSLALTVGKEVRVIVGREMEAETATTVKLK